MGNPEEIPNIEPFPLSPRFRSGEEVPKVGVPSSIPSAPASRPLSPLQRVKVEFWHAGEQASQVEEPSKSRRYNHARRADQMGLLMLIAAALTILVLVAALHLNNKKYSLKSDAAAKTTTPVIDFYQGNHAFDRKVKEEKEGSIPEALQAQGANEDFEITLQAQMSSMAAKLEKMRIEKAQEEAAPPLPDKGPLPVPVMGVRPAEMKKFDSPMEFNTMLPKAFREAK